MEMKTALTIGGSDSSGGAGIQADIKTMTAHGVYAMSAITSLTAQNTTGVVSMMEVPPEFLEAQIVTTVEDIFPDAVKTGTVASSALIEVIAFCLRRFDIKNYVLDPVMISKSGVNLISEDAVSTLKDKLLSLARLITPNISEAEALSDITITSEREMEVSAQKIFDEYGCSVLVTGGQRAGDASDFLFGEEFDGSSWRTVEKWFRAPRIETHNTHGTGCTLSAAIVSNLAKGLSLEEAVGRAKDYLTRALGEGLDLGSGCGPHRHGWWG